MRPESLKRAGRRVALTAGAIAVLSLFSFAPWHSDQNPALAQDVIVVPKEGQASNNSSFWNLFAPAPRAVTPQATAVKRPVQEPLPEPPPMIAVESFPELLVATSATTPEQDNALMAAVTAFSTPRAEAATAADFPDQAKPFLDFLAQYPNSGWAMAVHINLGLGYYRSGYYSRAITSYEQAWALGKTSTINEAKRLADRAIGELLRMHARIGHMDQIDTLLAEISDRDIQGSATELVTGTKQGLWTMRNRPEIAFLCGPKALVNVLSRTGGTKEQILIAHAAESGPKGFSLNQLSELTTKTGLKHRIIKREPGQPIPAPAIIHWKLNHYAAVVDEKDGRYLLDDPTFLAGAQAMTREAIDAEGSGYFIIPESAKPTGSGDAAAWRTVDPESDEAKAVFGMGAPSAINPDQTCCGGVTPTTSNQGPPLEQMATAAGNTYLINLAVRDAPVDQRTPIGPSAAVTLNYNHREGTQPASFKMSNIGFKWGLNWIAYLEDHPSAATYIYRYVGGGGRITYKNVGSSWAPKYQAEMLANGMIVRTPSDFSQPLSYYEVLFPDGSKHVYSHLDHTSVGRKVFLTQVVDAQGNATTFSYTNLTGTQGSVTCSTPCVRLDSFTDATAKTTTFSYLDSSWPLRITKVTDHFGRFSSLTYDSNERLTSITDPIGIVSSFAYGSGDFMSTLTTPYGDSPNAQGTNSTYGLWLEMTDALGQKERFEYSNTVVPNDINTDGTMKNAAHMPANYPYPSLWDCCRVMRNSFHWDRHVTSLQSSGTWDFDQAMLRHYTHDAHVGANTVAAPILNSMRPPLQRRIFFAYQDAISSIWSGLPASPIYTGVVLDNGTTQATLASYLNAGQPDKPHPVATLTDATSAGRTTKFTYGSNDIDLTKIEQKISSTPTYATLAEFTHDSNHNVLTKTDAAGQVWRYAYNAAGQLIFATNPLNETSFWEYDSTARLRRVTLPVAVAHTSVTYATDSNGQPVSGNTNASAATAQSLNYTSACSGMTAPDNTNLPISVTDSDGYVKCYEYDDLDRVVKIKYPDGTTDLYDYSFPSGLSSQPTWTTGAVPTAGAPSLDVWKVTDRQGRVTEHVYDRNRQLIKSTQKSLTINGTAGVDRTTQYAYYANGVLKDLTDANGNVTHWDIDIQSRPTSKTYASGTANAKTESYTYDVTGRLKTVTDALGQVKTYSYSVADEVTAITYTNHVDTNFPTPDVSFTYDTWYPRLATMADMSGLTGGGAPASATTTFAYVDPGTGCAPPSTLTNCGALKLRQETNNGYYNQHTAYFYDAAGRMSERWAAETQESFGYDTLGRLNSYGTPLGTFTLGYLNNTGQLASRSVTNGSITLSQSYGYDTNANDRRLLTITSSSNAMRSYTLGYVNGGGVDRYNIRSVTESTASHPIGAQTWAHNYDGGDRLISSVGTLVSNSGAASNAGTYGWELDKLDNPTKATYPDYGGYSDYPTYLNTASPPADNNLNQMNKNAWWQGYTFDANGNTTAEVDLNNSSAPLRTYKWDMEGRLLQMTDPNASGGHTVRFHYDGMGRRILQKTTTNGTTTYKRFQWCGTRICQQRTTSTARVRSYLLTGEYDFTASKKYVYFTDHLGSVRDLADADTGARVGALDYTPYGSERDSDGVLPDFRYAGLMWIGDMGLYMSSTRAYDPGNMRWLNRDPIRESGGINLYGYVGGNPLNAVDPMGLSSLTDYDLWQFGPPYDVSPKGPWRGRGGLDSYRPPDRFVITGHGRPNWTKLINGVLVPIIEGPEPDSYITPTSLVHLALANGWDGKMPIELDICGTSAGGSKSFAAEFSKEAQRITGRPVWVLASPGDILAGSIGPIHLGPFWPRGSDVFISGDLVATYPGFY